MKGTQHIAVFAALIIGTFGCSDFKDNGIGRVPRDFNDAITSISVGNQVDCAKQCDLAPTCMSFEYAGSGPGVGVNCTLRELPVVMDHFYTTKSDHRYYHKDGPATAPVGCYKQGTLSDDRLLVALDAFMVSVPTLNERDVMQHIVDLCAAYASVRGHKIFTVQSFTKCHAWDDIPDGVKEFQGFISTDDGCHQDNFEPLVGDNTHMSVFQILG